MNSDQLLKWDANHVWHPCTQMKDHETFPPVLIEYGQGVYLYDSYGARYLDAVSSWWVNLFGHNNKRLNNALNEQMCKVSHHIFANFTHAPAATLSAKLLKAMTYNLSKVFFTDNGSSAVEAALKMSFQYWQQSGFSKKTKFLSVSGAYHGETIGALGVSGCDLYKEIYKPILLSGYQAKGQDCYRCEESKLRDSCDAECFQNMDQIIKENHANIAAVIIEPIVQCAAGMRIYSPRYLQKLRQACDKYKIHYIADEIAVGFGRTGKMFANEHAGVSPDILCLSKSITGGYMPLSVVVTNDEIYQAFYDDYKTLKGFLHSHSYSGNPLACALAVEVLNIFEDENVIENLKSKISHLSSFKEKFESFPYVGEFRQIGMIAAIELVKDKRSKEGFPWEERIGFQIFKEGLKRGAILRPLGNVIYFFPPLSITDKELDELSDITCNSMNAVFGV